MLISHAGPSHVALRLCQRPSVEVGLNAQDDEEFHQHQKQNDRVSKVLLNVLFLKKIHSFCQKAEEF